MTVESPAMGAQSAELRESWQRLAADIRLLDQTAESLIVTMVD